MYHKYKVFLCFLILSFYLHIGICFAGFLNLKPGQIPWKASIDGIKQKHPDKLQDQGEIVFANVPLKLFSVEISDLQVMKIAGEYFYSHKGELCMYGKAYYIGDVDSYMSNGVVLLNAMKKKYTEPDDVTLDGKTIIWNASKKTGGLAVEAIQVESGIDVFLKVNYYPSFWYSIMEKEASDVEDEF